MTTGEGRSVKAELKSFLFAALCALALRLMLPTVRDALGTSARAFVAAGADADAIVETIGALIAPGGMRGALAYAFSPSREYISCFVAGL